MPRRRFVLVFDADVSPTHCAQCGQWVGWLIHRPGVSLMVNQLPEARRVAGLDALQVEPHVCQGRSVKAKSNGKEERRGR